MAPPDAGGTTAAAAAGAPAPPAQQQQQQRPLGTVWLAPERFDVDAFSPDECVAELRRFVPLPTVKAELQSYLTQLKSQLVEAINADYPDYVSLSAKLAGLEGAVVRMRSPLVEIQGKLSEVQDAITAELQALQQGLQRRQDAAAARDTLELMQEVFTCTGKVEKLLQEVAAAAAASEQQQGAPATPGSGPPSSGGGADAAAAAAGAAGGGGDDSEIAARCRLLVRVAGEASRLLFLVERGKHLAFVQSLERRINSCRMQLDMRLQAAALAALAASDWGAASNCLRGYLELGEPGRAEEALRAGLVGPIVRDVVASVRQQQLAAGGGGAAAPPGGGLTAVVDGALQALHSRAGPLLAQLLARGGGMAGLDLLGAVLLAELSQAIADGMPGVFSPGNPASFQAAYLAGQGLLARLEGMAPSRAALERLRGGPAAAGWAKRWNTAVYFSLVYQDIAGTFEAAVKAGKLAPASEAALAAPLPSGDGQQQQQQQLALAASATLWGCLQRVVSPSVFLLPLADRFVKLAAQLLVRYDTWLQDVVAARQQALAAAAAGGSGGGAPHAQPGSDGAAPAAPGAAAAGAGGGGSGPAAWAGSLSAEDCAVISTDADSIQGLVAGPFCGQLASLLASLPGEVVEQLQGMMGQLAERIGSHGQQVLLLIGGDVLERCMAAVRQLKGITATYRMTAKGPPVRHSHYVAGVLQPLRQLLEAPGPVQRLPPRLQRLLVSDVVDGVNSRYNALAEELLTSVKKTESSLKRLKKSRPGEADAGGGGAGASGAAGMSDSDKICLQLYLDVQEHGRQIVRFGLAPEGMPSFGALLATVTPADRAGEAAPGAAPPAEQPQARAAMLQPDAPVL